MEGQWLWRWAVSWGKNSNVTEVASLRRENGHVTEVVSLMERKWSCYRGGQFNGGKMIMLIWSV